MTSELDQFFQDEPTTARNELDQFFDDGSAARAKLGVRFSGSSPDKEAEAVKLARRYSIPPALASQFVEDYRERAKADDANAVIDKSPKLRDWLAADNTRAKVASDDIETLGSLESLLGSLGKAGRYVVSAPGTERGLATDAVSVVRALAAGAPQFSAGVYGAAAYPFEAVGLDSAGEFFRQAQRISQGQSDRVAAVDPNAGIVERGIMSGLRSAGQQLVTLPAGVASAARVTGEQVMLGLMGLTTFGQSYGKARDQGAGVGRSAFYGLEDATAEVITEKYLGAAKLLGDAKAGMGAAKLFVRDIAREIPGEMGATLWQNFNEWATLNPEKTVSEFLAEQPAALAETVIATIVGGGAQVGAIRATQRLMGDSEQEAARAQRAQEIAATIEQAGKLATASKLAQRDATSFKTLVDEIADETGDAPTELYIDPQTLANTLNQSGVTMAELQAIAPVVASQLTNPQAGDIRIPVSEFLSAGEAVTAPLIDHLRATPDAMTRAEAQQFLKEQGDSISRQVEEALQANDNQAQIRQSIDALRTEFEAELGRAGRFTGNVNKAYADLLANFYAATAQRAGMAPEQLLQKYRLRVQSDLTGQERTLNQADTTTPEFQRWFGDSRVVDADGKPLVVYHGTTGDFNKFSRIDGGNAYGPGYYFTASPAEASGYADGSGGGRMRPDGDAAPNVMPVYLSAQNVYELDGRTLTRTEIGKLEAASNKLTPGAWKKGELAKAFDRAYPPTAQNVMQYIAQSAGGTYSAIAQAAGYDGLRGSYGFVAFRAEQIKSAIGNRGTFDPNDANILNQSAIPAEQSTDENGLPVIRSEEVELAFAQPAERLEFIPVEGQQMYNLAILQPGSWEPVGYVELVFEDGKVTSLYDIEVEQSARNGGIGAKVIEAILAANPDAKILISNVVPAARGFWEQVGIPQQNVGEGDAYDGTLDWNTYADSPAGRKRGAARREARPSEGPGGRRIPGVQGEPGEGSGGVLEQGQKQVGPRAQLALPADITANPSVISLLQGADLSSFIHESGHFFLEVQNDLAQRIQQQIDSGASVTEAERGIVNDMNQLLAWFGVKGNESLSPLQEWATMSLDEKRESHEKFARGFEAYTMEGKAPSIELQGVFQRFRSWLLQVYKTLRNLNVELNDDVRAVMGRMLATDFAIEEAEAQRNMGPLFRDAEKAGMTLEEYERYQATAKAATDTAAAELQVRSMKDLKWLSGARDKALKARQQEVDELRREIRNEVRSEVMREPVYQAWQFLTGKQDQVTPGAQAVEEVDTVQQSGRLRTQVLRDMYGTEETAIWRELSARRMTSDSTGMHPEIVAEMFGFDSADALVKKLVDAMPPQEVIDARTDQRMLEMFGDIGSPEALQRAADEAVHNEARARFIASELKALEKANKVTERRNKSTVDLMAKAAKNYAQQIIGRLKVREIRPSQYASAEARAAKLANKAFMAGKLEEAAMHKRNQLVNNYATRAAYEAQEEVQKAQKYFRKFDKRSKTIDAGYLDQIEQLLERFDFKPASLKEIERRKSFTAWLEEQRAEGIEPNVPAELLDEASRKSFKDMTLEELRGLRETVEQLEHLGRLKNRLLLARDQRDFDAAAEEMAASIIEHGGKIREVNLEGPNPVTDWFAGVAAQHRKLASLFRQMDGNKDAGPMYELIGRAMNERGTMEDVMNEKATVELQKLYAPLLKMKGGITGSRSKLYIPDINASLTRGGRLAVALNWGNEANRQRLMDGDKWSEAQVRAILRTLSPAELEFVNKTWEYLDSFWPEVAAKEKRLTGAEPEKVEASPFNVIASDGTEVAMRGGYYPLVYDAERSDRSSQQDAAQVAKEMMQGAFTRATTRRGHTKERLKEVKRAVRKDLNVITQHITQVTHDLAWHEWLIDTNKLLGDERVSEAILAHYGKKVLKTIRDGVMGIATADVAPQTDIDKALLKLRSNVTRATMGASLTTAFLQPFGLTQSMVRIGPKHVLRGIARWGGEAVRMENTLSWVHEKSDFMRLRAKTFNKELREIRGSVAGKSKAMRVVDAGLFAMMQKMQMVADVPTWVGQYEKSIAEGLDEKAAVAMADRMVLESQGGGQTKDLAEVQRKHPMLTQFYSYFSVTLNLAAEQTAATNFKNPAAVAGWLGDMALLMVIPAIVPSLLMHVFKGGGDDEETIAKKLVEWQLGYLLGTVVGLRELSGAVGGFDYAGPPVGRLIADIGKAGKQTAQGEVDDAAVMAYINLMGSAFGIPTVQALRSYKGWKAWDEGQEGAGPQSVLFGPPPKN